MSTENYACELYSKMTRMPDGLYFGEMQSSKNFRDYRHGKGVMLFDAGFYY